MKVTSKKTVFGGNHSRVVEKHITDRRGRELSWETEGKGYARTL